MNPYDELPYRSQPIEWTAPERLALTSLLHGGPRVPLDAYRVLELGCGDAANLIPLAYYRPDATFVGVDSSAAAIAAATRHRDELGLGNLQLIHDDFGVALDGRFDFILAHGVLSWIPDDARDALLALCARHVGASRLVYLNYNARPGWNVRGMVRDFLRAHTAHLPGLLERAALAQEAAAQLAAALAAAGEHPYSQLMEGELRFVAEGERSYVAHEFLAEHNRAYWQSELDALARGHGLAPVAEADFNHPSGRVPDDLAGRLAQAGLDRAPLGDTLDLLCYRQLRSPILTPAPFTARLPTVAELAGLVVASCLAPEAPGKFRHPSGFEVEVRDPSLAAAFERLAPGWPGGLPLGDLVRDPAGAFDDLRLLYQHGMIDLRLHDPARSAPDPVRLHALERRLGRHPTTAQHTRLPLL